MRSVPREETVGNLPAAWPQYTSTPIDRTLAVMVADGRLLTEHGEYLSPRSWQDLSDMLFLRNLQVFIGAVASAMQDWQDEMIADMDEENRRGRGQWCELQWSINRNELSCVRIHRLWPDKNGHRLCWQVRNLTVSSAWARVIEPELITDLRYLFNLLETGVLATPGSVGRATITRLWSGKKPSEFRRHYRPSLALIAQLEKHAIGSRREAYRPTEIFDEAYELDACNGYCSQAGELPCGAPIYYHDGQRELWTTPRDDFFCWWGDCWVRIYDNGLAPGDIAPFATRDEDGQLHWPTSAGLYHTWLWSFEAEDLRRRELEGEPIACLGVGNAWAWTESTTQLKEWQAYMDQKRREAKYGDGGSKARSDLVKICIVAGIGGLGLPYTQETVHARDIVDAIPLSGPGLPDVPLYLTSAFHDSGTPKHWQSYILAKMNFRVYQEMRRCFLEDIPVAACNVDGIITLRRAYWGSDPEYVRIGEFKIKKLGTWVSCPGPGMILDPDNNRIQVPGMSREEKNYAMGLKRIGEEPVQRRGEKRNQRRDARASWGNAAHAGAIRMREYILRNAG